MAERVTLVIPGRNVERVVRACLDAVVQLLGHDGPEEIIEGIIEEIIFVDDGSTDRTAAIVAEYPVRCVRGEGRGAAAARNLGWRMATTELVWFIDADCVAEPGALGRLLPHLSNADVAGAGGSYANMCPDSLLACLVHEEIIERHLRMPAEVGVLATFNVVYRRDVLEEVGGFDPAHYWAHDAELAFRICKAGYRLRFERRSRVAHFHPMRLGSYLGKQRQQGYYRVLLYLRHPGGMLGDSYSGLADYVQPPLAMLMLAALPLLAWPTWGWMPAVLAIGLLLAQAPMSARIIRRRREWRYALFAPLGFLRAIFRGLGMCTAAIHCLAAALRKKLHTAIDNTAAATPSGPSPHAAGSGALRVWYVTMVFPVASETFVGTEIAALRRAGVDVSVAALAGRLRAVTPVRPGEGLSGLVVRHGTMGRQILGLGSCLVRPWLAWRLLRLIFTWSRSNARHLGWSLLLIPHVARLFVEIERERPDVVHLYWGHYPSLLGHLVQSYLPDVLLSTSLSAYDLCAGFGCSQPVVRRADVVRTWAAANTPAIAKLGVAPERIFVCYQGVDVARWDNRVSDGKVPRRIVSAGRLTRAKAMDDVVDAFGHILQTWPDASLVILGGGPEHQHLSQRIRQWKIDDAVELRGHVAHEEVFRELANAEVFLFLSFHKAERLPNVVKEAMACDALCVVSETPGMDELLQDGRHGYLVSQHDVAEAASRVDEVFRDVAAHRAMIDAAKDRLRTAFDVDVTVAALARRWEHLLGEKRSGPRARSLQAQGPLVSAENRDS